MLRPDPFARPSASTARTIAGTSCRSTSREATIPTTPGCQPSPATTMTGADAQLVGEPAEGGLGLVGDLPLGLAALVVGGVELGGDRRGASGVVGEHQLDPGVGAVEAPGGVQPRAEAEGDVALVDPLGLDPGGFHQRPQAGAGRAPDLVEPAADQEAVLADERDEVGDGGERDEVEVADRRLRPAGPPTLQRLGELRGDRRAAQRLERVAADLAGWTIGQSGSSSPGWWWSVTTTAIPAASMAATSATEAIPQSTVTTRPLPRSSSVVKDPALSP